MLDKLRQKLASILSPSDEKVVSSESVNSANKEGEVINSYDPNLISIFEKEHRVLLGMYKRIHASATSGDSNQVKADLGKFRLLFTGHLLKENQRLYSHLFSALKDDVSVEMAKSMKTEMDQIGRVVLSFISKYSEESATIDDSFLPDLEEIGSALVARIRNEEQHLYPNYLPTT